MRIITNARNPRFSAERRLSVPTYFVTGLLVFFLLRLKLGFIDSLGWAILGGQAISVITPVILVRLKKTAAALARLSATPDKHKSLTHTKPHTLP